MDMIHCKICLLIQSVALFLDCCIIFGWLHPIRIITAYACRFICLFFTGYIWCYNRRSHLTQIIWVTPICDNLSILSIRSIWWNMRLNRSISTLERLKNHKIPQSQPNFKLCASPYILQLFPQPWEDLGEPAEGWPAQQTPGKVSLETRPFQDRLNPNKNKTFI